MIIRDYLILDTDVDFILYKTYNNFDSFDKRLNFLPIALDPQAAEALDITVDIMPTENWVNIWTLKSFKQPAEINFTSLKEEEAFENAYDKYYDKRWDEMPQIDLSFKDWQDLQSAWQKIHKKKPKIIVFELDDSGPSDKVEVFGQDELSQGDIDYIKQEHEKYLKYEQARQKYIEHHPDYSDVWRGPQDDEYEADIMKYYDQE